MVRVYIGYIGILAVILTSLSWQLGKPTISKRTFLDLTLQYSDKKRHLTILLFVFWTFFLFILAWGGLIRREEVFAFFAFSVLMITFAIAEIVKVYGLVFSITEDGISRRFWTKTLLIKWEEVDSVYFRRHLTDQRFVITSSKGRINLCSDLNGLRAYAKAIQDNLPYEKWERAENVINLLLSK